MTIALNMIVGPFEEVFMPYAIGSTVDLVNEMIFIDTSPGNNPNRDYLDTLIHVYNAKDNEIVKIIDMPRGEDKDFSFAEARELARVNTESEWVLRLDADEILHEDTIGWLKDFTYKPSRYSSVEVSFYHHMVYPWLFQYIEPKEILFKRDCFHWEKGVHELPYVTGPKKVKHELKFHHMGYCRGQEEVFKRWQLYVDIDGKPEWYSGTNPATILDDRISVCQNFSGKFPKVLEPILDKLFPNWREMYD